ncbi:MAG: macro domain-containing protein [Firmicutes bacterium]|nr:macro domain-containing protein [Bacillota bacterium]
MTLKIIRNDITKLDVEAIVCPSNSRLLEGSGTSYRIYKAAGEKLLNEACKKIEKCEMTKAVMTSGFNLSKYIIHVVGPVYDIGSAKEEEMLAKTYENALKLAYKNHIHSIAFPLLSSGNYGFPKELSLQIGFDAITKFLLKHEIDVWIVVYDQESTEYAKKIMPIEERIDQKYVEDRNEDYADSEFLRKFKRNLTIQRNVIETVDFCLEEEATILKPSVTNYVREKKETSTSKIKPKLSLETSKRSLDDLMKGKSENFKDMLLRLIDERGFKDSEVYKAANVSKQHFNKIKNVEGYTPKKPTILSMAIVLKLSLDETIDLLAKAGQAFSDCSKTDIIVRYYIENRFYDLYEINQTLNNYHLEALCL